LEDVFNRELIISDGLPVTWKICSILKHVINICGHHRNMTLDSEKARYKRMIWYDTRKQYNSIII
jgi:hypothetical protein